MYQMNSLNYISNSLITHNQQVNSVIKTFLYRNTKKLRLPFLILILPLECGDSNLILIILIKTVLSCKKEKADTAGNKSSLPNA